MYKLFKKTKGILGRIHSIDNFVLLINYLYPNSSFDRKNRYHFSITGNDTESQKILIQHLSLYAYAQQKSRETGKEFKIEA